MKNHRYPYANLLSANYGVERLGGFQMPIRSRMTSYQKYNAVHTTYHRVYTYR
jgi:hypothetical protein